MYMYMYMYKYAQYIDLQILITTPCNYTYHQKLAMECQLQIKS